MARMSLYIVAIAVTLAYLGMLHDQARWLSYVRVEAIQSENNRVHKALVQHPGIWSQTHPTTYSDLCRDYVRFGVLDQTSANYYIHLDAIRSPRERMSITYPSGPVPVITGQDSPSKSTISES